MIIVTGPTGNTGKQIVHGLKKRNIPFTALVRSDARAKELAAQGVPTVIADFENVDSLKKALSGAIKAYLVCTPDERLARCEQNFIRAARHVGLRHIVKCGAYGADAASPSPNLRLHAEAEAALIDSDISYTIIRPHGFMQTFFAMSAQLVMEQGILRLPAGDGPMPLIDLRDVGAALLKALIAPGHENRIYSLTGPQALTGQDMSAALSQAFGRRITYVDSPLGELDALMRQLGVPDAPRNHVLWCFREQRAGRLNYTSLEHNAFGLQLRTFADFANDLVAGTTGVAFSDFSH